MSGARAPPRVPSPLIAKSGADMPRSLLTVTLVALTQVALPSAQTLAAEGHTSDAVSPGLA